MSRIPDQIENRREIIEGQLACLGNALVRLELVDMRIQHISIAVGSGELISPAFDDLQQARNLVKKVQRSIAEGFH